MVAEVTLQERVPRGGASRLLRSLSLWLVLGLLCLAWAWLLPEHYLPWSAFRQEALALLGFALLAGAALGQLPGVVWPRTAVVLCLVAIIPVVQWSAGLVRYRDDAILAAGYLVVLGLSVCTGASLAAGTLGRQFRQGFVACLVFTGIVSSGMAFCQWLGPDVLMNLVQPMPVRGRPSANIGQPNHLSTLLLLSLAALLYWYEQRQINGRVAAFAGVWIGWGVVMAQSRTGWIAVGLLTLWWLVMRRRTQLRLPPTALVLGLTIFLMAVLAEGHLFVLWNGPPDLDGTDPALRLHAGNRLGYWFTLWHALLQSPWFGFGWSGISAAQFLSASHFPAIGEWLAHSHNLVLDLLIYNGLPLGLMLIALLVLWFAGQIRQCGDSAHWCWLLGLFFLLLHALLEFPLHYSYFLVPAGLLIGLVDSGRGTTTGATRPTLAIPAALAIGVLGAVAAEYVEAEESLRDLRLASFNVGKAAADLPKPDWVLLESWKAYHVVVSMKIEENMAARDLETLGQVAQRYPYPNVLSGYAEAAALNGLPEVARQMLVHACKVHNETVCDAVKTWWARLGLRHSQIQRIDFPFVEPAKSPHGTDPR